MISLLPQPALSNYTTLRLIMGDQLNANHSWFKDKREDVLYVMAELHQEQDYVTHHIQKICGFFAAMQQFATGIAKAGHHVLHLTLDDTENLTLDQLITTLLKRYHCSQFEYQLPDEQRLYQQLSSFSKELDSGSVELASIKVEAFDTEHFLLPLEEIPQYFKPQQHNRMETFYRKMRKRFSVLMEGNQPAGGKWNYDADNRQSFKMKDVAALPEPLIFSNDVKDILDRLKRHNIQTIGKAEQQLLWPINRKQSQELLTHFCQVCLPRFGQFQDAMTHQSSHGWSAYHSRLSFSINSKMLHPMQVIQAALDSYHNSSGAISLSQIEGFIRQILGWREYVRGIYWINQPDYAKDNVLNAHRPLPQWFWTGKTKMKCMQAAITQSLDYAYAHHIQRLMVTGNFALLVGIEPKQVEDWYLGIYMDAIEWVEQPNTRSMALFADGGWVATKPYSGSGNYINKMSDYCKSCAYKVKEKTTEQACPFNSLYWQFLHRNQELLGNNPRIAFPYKSWQKMDEAAQQAIIAKAERVLEQLELL